MSVRPQDEWEFELVAESLEEARVLIERVASEAKHGPMGSGEAGPCAQNCLKCRAAEWLERNARR